MDDEKVKEREEGEKGERKEKLEEREEGEKGGRKGLTAANTPCPYT